MKRLTTILAATLLAALLIAGCTGGASAPPQTEPPADETETPASETLDPADPDARDETDPDEQAALDFVTAFLKWDVETMQRLLDPAQGIDAATDPVLDPREEDGDLPTVTEPPAIDPDEIISIGADGVQYSVLYTVQYEGKEPQSYLTRVRLAEKSGTWQVIGFVHKTR